MEKLGHSPKHGFALLLTMSILMVLSIALIQIFENRSLEVAQLDNSTQQFKAESVARSVFRVLLGAIHERGLYQVVSANRQYQKFGFSTDVADLGVLTDLLIQPVDFRFELNQKFKGDASDRETVFKNMLILCQKENESQDTGETYFELNDRDVYGIVSAINDWRDDDSDPYPDYGEGIEFYGSVEYPFEVKNSPFDFLSEIKLIPGINQLKLSDFIIKKYFRVVGNGRIPDEFININLGLEGEIVQFLNRYDGVSKYETAVANALEIEEIILRNPGNQTDPYFKNTSDFFKALEQEGVILEEEKKLFKVQSKYVEIKYIILVDQYQLGIYSLIELNNDGKNGIIIHTFSIN
ncbi:MAG: hypothetical protein HOD92_04740 [Deltaproteobacteria bacterium]|nr:hypothetical protein [Deltaproteobacteria bacterium]MBT4525097.1 hypothetical protein [Deltaproteobacteria bacterium]